MRSSPIDASWYRRPPHCPERVSAGGVVVRRMAGVARVALVHETGMSQFVLPKGGVEPGEDLEQAARREITEETGLSDLRLIRKLAVKERLSHDRTYWAVMHHYLFVTVGPGGSPTDDRHRGGPWWFPLNALPVLYWPEQVSLLHDCREVIEAMSIEAAAGDVGIGIAAPYDRQAGDHP